MAKDIVDEMIDDFFSNPNVIGKLGEMATSFELRFSGLFGKKGRILKNVYLPKGDNETTEIDLLYITQKGIFVIESKNYSGWIFGGEQDAYWTLSLPNKQKKRFYSPIKQNQNHIKWLREFLNTEFPMYSMIVFSDRCELKKVTVESPDVYVVKREDLFFAIRDAWNKTDDCMTKEQVDNLYDKLKILTNADAALKQKHIENVEKKYKAPAGESPVEKVICPKCGAELVLRTAKKGANAGNQFYGCSNFPKCRYIQNLD